MARDYPKNVAGILPKISWEDADNFYKRFVKIFDKYFFTCGILKSSLGIANIIVEHYEPWKGDVAMVNKPHHFVLRCYGYKDKRGKWYGVCLDLNLAAEADSLASLKSKLDEMINCYIETVFDTKDQASIPNLLRRKAPLRDRICYGLIYAHKYIRNIPDWLTFDTIVPFTLAHNC